MGILSHLVCVQVGDRVIPVCSLTTLPLKLTKIKSIHGEQVAFFPSSLVPN